MRVARYTHIIIAVLMMTFVTQAVAAASMYCQHQTFESPIQTQMVAPDSMDHSRHSGMTTASDRELSECCADCDCALGGCVTAVLPASQATLTPNHSSLIDRYISQADNQLAVSLYRPPISR